MDECNTQKVQMGRYEERLTTVEQLVRKMMDNHLPHIQDELTTIKLQQAYWSGGLAALIFAMGLALKFL